MPVRLTRPYIGQAANTIYASGYTPGFTRDTEYLLLAEGGAVTDLDSATDYVAFQQYRAGIQQIANGEASGLAMLGVATARLSTTGRRLIMGRVANAAYALEGTHELLIEVAGDFRTATPWYVAGGGGGAVAVTAGGTSGAIVRAVPDTTAASSNAAARYISTLGGAATWSHAPASSATRRNNYKGDVCYANSVPRTDGGTGRLIVIRLHVTAGQIIVTGDGTQNFANWFTRDRGRIYRTRFAPGATDYSTSGNWSGFDAVAVQSSGSPIAGVEYLSSGLMGSISIFGDSNGSGQGDDNAAISYIGEGFGTPLAETLSASASGILWEHSDFSWAGLPMANIRNHVIDAVAAGLAGDVAFYPDGEVNSGSAPMVATDIDSSNNGAAVATYSALIQNDLAAAKNIVIPYTWEPTLTAAKAFGAGDSFRRAYVAQSVGRASRGQVIADFNAAVSSGVMDGAGQMQPTNSLIKQTDLIHFNRAGNAVRASVAANAVRRAFLMQSGAAISA